MKGKIKRKHFNAIGLILIAVLGAVIGQSIKAGDPVMPVIAIAAGTGLMYLLKRRVDEIVEDERIYRMGEKASYAAFKVFVMAIAVIGVVFVALSRGVDPVFEQTGYTLLISMAALMGLYMLFYGYYSRKGV